MALSSASPRCRDDKEIVIEAVKNNPWAFVSEERVFQIQSLVTRACQIRVSHNSRLATLALMQPLKYHSSP